MHSQYRRAGISAFINLQLALHGAGVAAKLEGMALMCIHATMARPRFRVGQMG